MQYEHGIPIINVNARLGEVERKANAAEARDTQLDLLRGFGSLSVSGHSSQIRTMLRCQSNIASVSASSDSQP
jgi:hypothetical protein